MKKAIIFTIVLTILIVGPNGRDFEKTTYTYQDKKYDDCIFVPTDAQPWWTKNPVDQTICFREKKWLGMTDYAVAFVVENGKVIPVEL